MRDIKFRAFNTIDREMIYDLNSPYLRNGVLTHDSDDILMQYTGLKDANGVEIYEGDLIELCNNKNGCVQVGFENAYVGGWVLTVPQNKHAPLSLGARKASDIEIIGNIYENLELLEGVDDDN